MRNKTAVKNAIAEFGFTGKLAGYFMGYAYKMTNLTRLELEQHIQLIIPMMCNDRNSYAVYMLITTIMLESGPVTDAGTRPPWFDANASKYKRGCPAKLYYLRLAGGVAYKIGVTRRTIEERYPSSQDVFTVLMEKYYKDGKRAFKKERLIVEKFAKYIYRGPKLLSAGNNEVFNRDVLGLDV